ncbi:unnamed protein product [Nezara viridula]|uniref:Uncharacterized protein n=1 Tax=Nezara viridula TaxID=85310 RepID=A0A9P0HEL4_NEZVI|nr:unnamed protein product [Nezara viridula]
MRQIVNLKNVKNIALDRAATNGADFNRHPRRTSFFNLVYIEPSGKDELNPPALGHLQLCPGGLRAVPCPLRLCRCRLDTE